jgi:hypothetical protein
MRNEYRMFVEKHEGEKKMDQTWEYNIKTDLTKIENGGEVLTAPR